MMTTNFTSSLLINSTSTTRTLTTTTNQVQDQDQEEAPERQQQTDYIHLRSHSNLKLLLSRLRGGQVYEQTHRLIVVCPGCEPDWNCPEISTLFGTGFQYLTSNLMELKLNCIGLLDVPFPLRLLRVVVDSCPPTLQSLELDDVALNCSTTTNNNSGTITTTATTSISTEGGEETSSGSEEKDDDATALGKAIQRKSLLSLRQFRLFGCLADDTLRLAPPAGTTTTTTTLSTTTSVLLNPFWMSLSTLQKVQLDAVDDGLLGDIQPTTVGYLLRSNSLQTFHLNGFALNDECLQEMATALQTNTVLVDLSLDLYTVGSSSSSGTGRNGGGGGGFAFVDALRQNQQLKRLHISISHAWNDDAFLGSLAEALKTSCTLESLILGTCAIIRDTTAQAFATMLEENCSLRVLQLSRYNGAWKPLISYYLFLNHQAKRGYYHSNYDSLSRLEWINGLINIRDNLDAIYYFLQMNPALYCG